MMEENNENNKDVFMTRAANLENAQATMKMTPHTARGIDKSELPKQGDIQIPDVEIVDILGEGGMGVVYKGKQTYIDRLVAVKVMKRFHDGSFEQRFKREAKILANLSHPNIVACYGAGVADDCCYIVMEFIEGIDLYNYIKKEGVLSEKQALHVIQSLAKALEYAWDQGIMHRDIKAENVLLEKINMEKQQSVVVMSDFPYKVKLVDLGLAKGLRNDEQSEEDGRSITQAGNIIGTPSNMAPEQFDGESNKIDFRADVYALGCVLYFMLTGKRAYYSTSLVEIIKRKISFPAPDPKDISKLVSEKTRKLTKHLLQREIKDRPQSYGEIIASCEASTTVKKKNTNSVVPLILILMISLVFYKTVMYLKETSNIEDKNIVENKDAMGNTNTEIKNTENKNSTENKNTTENKAVVKNTNTEIKNIKDKETSIPSTQKQNLEDENMSIKEDNLVPKKSTNRKVIWKEKYRPLFVDVYSEKRIENWRSSNKSSSEISQWVPFEDGPGVVGLGAGFLSYDLPKGFWKIKGDIKSDPFDREYGIIITNNSYQFTMYMQNLHDTISTINFAKIQEEKRILLESVTHNGKKEFSYGILYKNNTLYFTVNGRKLHKIGFKNPEKIMLTVDKAKTYFNLKILEEKDN